ncbi:MAG: class I SAM-dependent methyltransferase [Proteobacteria bacterium]|nr:class I SAM-dependent methyltransferase [Pseudomonadota bacterium]
MLRAQLAVANAQKTSYRALLREENPPLAAATDTYQILTYVSDGLATWNKSIDFFERPRFQSAYRRGMNSGHRIGRAAGSDHDIRIEWRVAICCWAAWHGRQLPGDFVECGTNTGIYSLAVCEYIDVNSTEKSFWLFDTFAGHPAEQLNPQERRLHEGSTAAGTYSDVYEIAQRNFAPFPKAHLVRGKVPDTLGSVAIDKVAYLSIDMNLEYPERAALKFFWPKLVPGGIVVLDDYGWLQHRSQKDSHDAFATAHGVEIFALPTGQGLLLKV